jgi:hypothetical protein
VIDRKHVAYATRNSALYQQFTRDAYLDGADVLTESGNLAVYNRLLFALLSVNTDYKVTARAYLAMKNRYHTDGQKILEEYMAHGIHHAGARAGYLAQATELYIADPLAFMRQGDESWSAYRFRLVKLIPGLSFIKVSFFIGMVYRNADLCCLDRWMLRSIGFKEPERAMKQIGKGIPICSRRYGLWEHRLRKVKPSTMSLPAFQWAVWDSIQGTKPNPMGVLS